MSVRPRAVLGAAWTIVWKSVLYFLIWGLLLAPFLVPFGAALERWERLSPLEARSYGDLIGALTLLAATWVMVRLIDRRPWGTVGLGLGRLPRDIPRGVAIGAAWLALSVGGAWASGCLVLQRDAAVDPSILLGAAPSVVLNVFTQQLLLCGYVFQTIQAKAGPLAALVVSALLFTLYHAAAFHGAWLPPVNVFAAGLLFGLAYLRTGRLWLGTGIHFAWNYSLGPLLGLTVSGSSQLGNGWQVLGLKGPALLTGGEFGLEGGVIVTATTVLVIFVPALVGVLRGRPAGGYA